MKSQIELLLVNPQHDFCDPSGVLFVKGANEAMLRMARMIDRTRERLSGITVALDNHHDIHIAHPIFWIDRKGRHPEPFTILGFPEVAAGDWVPTIRAEVIRKRAVQYASDLHKLGRYPFVIWPPHCIIGSVGQTIVPELHESIRHWNMHEFSTTWVITKGTNIFTDCRSAIQADVPDPLDPATAWNDELVTRLFEADTVFIAGQPANDAVTGTIRDLADAALDPNDLRKFVLITDSTTPAPGFEKEYNEFLQHLRDRKMRFASTNDF